ncbi:hypothetical protein PQ469_07290 [Mucilaginibacter sp. KACC 22773]|uniref:hypothetical protein n=1 Tax=Mucilaginibacter sp. KACC 22773 TaxID=3025671 RepID=UPI0023673000|nr:hypothetical protein [Mucilaginibacter sp. KACC 22773]WDF79809.1 hypothetical protein PQ469_07290 [Mucilaginibacter sp. KACC 22773]
MRIKVIPTLLAILVFVFLTVFYTKNDEPVDGVTSMGFPWLAYWKLGGKTAGHQRHEYFSSLCLLNLGIASLSIVTCNVMFHLLYLRKNYLTTYKTS